MIYERPLSVVHDEIRLLQIEPSNNLDSEIKCQLLQTSLGSAHNYVALSYCWGDPNIKGKIRIANRRIMVTQSLINALQELRRRKYLCVWADAVCIDQSNLEERSQQVLRMAGIYRSASKVVSFLHCKPLLDARVVSTLFRRISSEAENTEKAQKEYKKQKKRRRKERRRRQRREQGFDNSVQAIMFGLWGKGSPYRASPSELKQPPRLHVELKSNERRALFRLLFNPYWRRAWIIQEISANTDLEIIWGRQVFELESLVKLARLAVKHEYIQHTSQLRYLQYIGKIRASQLDMQPHTILDVISMTRGARASEPRDKIYAILGVTSNGSILVPFPNYSLSDFAVNRDITIRMIQRTKHLDFLLFKHDPVGTWCLDWFNPNSFSDRRMQSFIRPKEGSSERPYNACNKSLGEFEVRDDSISIRGFFVDQIVQCSPTLAEAHQEKSKTSQWKNVRHHRDQVPDSMKSDVISCSKSLEWLLHDVKLHNVFGATSTEKNANHLSGLLSYLHKIENGSKIAQRLIQWLYCCSKNSVKVEGYHLASWLAHKDHRSSGRSETMNTIHRNLEAQMRLGTTGQGLLGWFNKNARPGDKIAILLGCRFPAILRTCGRRGYCVVGEAVVHGLMFGEGMPKGQPDSIELVNFASIA